MLLPKHGDAHPPASVIATARTHWQVRLGRRKTTSFIIGCYCGVLRLFSLGCRFEENENATIARSDAVNMIGNLILKTVGPEETVSRVVERVPKHFTTGDTRRVDSDLNQVGPE